MSRRLYIQDNTSNDLTGAISSGSTSTTGSNANTSTQINTDNQQVPITVTLNQSTTTDTINTTKIVTDYGIINYLTSMNNLILINEIPEESGLSIDRTIYMKEQIGFYFKYKTSADSAVSCGFMGFINNTKNNYNEFAFFKQSNLLTFDKTIFINSIDNIYLTDYLADIHCKKIKLDKILIIANMILIIIKRIFEKLT